MVSGSVAYDDIMKFDWVFSEHILADKIHNLSVAFTVSDLQKINGGTAHNICYGLWLLWFRDQSIMLASVGKDFIVNEKFSKFINYNYILKDNESFTACAYIISDSKNNQITSFYPGPMYKSVGQHIIDYLDQGLEYVMVSPQNKDVMIAQLKECKENNIKCFFDPGQAMTLFNKEELEQALGACTYIICNEYEFDSISAKTLLDKNAMLNIVEKIIITLWWEGVKLIDKSGEKIISWLKIENVEPTWAWDNFRSGLLASLLVGNDRETSVKVWNVVALRYLMAKSQWNLNHDLTPEDIKQNVKNQFKEIYNYEINI